MPVPPCKPSAQTPTTRRGRIPRVADAAAPLTKHTQHESRKSRHSSLIKHMSIHNVTASLPNGDITIETGKLAKLADGAVTVRMGETIVIVTAVSSTKLKEGQDWFPLSVEYKEKAAAAGKFP